MSRPTAVKPAPPEAEKFDPIPKASVNVLMQSSRKVAEAQEQFELVLKTVVSTMGYNPQLISIRANGNGGLELFRLPTPPKIEED